MNRLRSILGLVAGTVLLIPSCAHELNVAENSGALNGDESESPVIAIGEWKNLYRGDPELAGVELSQCLREGPTMRDDSEYCGKHPAEIAYHFWDGRIRWITYYPDGKKMGDQWMKHGDPAQFSGRNDTQGYSLLKDLRRVEHGNHISSWGSVDFSFGSDPQFKRHKDPRIALDDAVTAYEERLNGSGPPEKQIVEQVEAPNRR